MSEEAIMFEYHLEHICSINATLDPNREQIGPTPEGLKINIYVTGGEVTGPRIKGKVRPVGADWYTLRTDGVGILNVRATLETDDGALIYMTYRGVSDAGEGAYERFLKGEPPAGGAPIHTAPVLTTSHPDYLWVNRILCLGVGESFPESKRIGYDIYAVRAGKG